MDLFHNAIWLVADVYIVLAMFIKYIKDNALVVLFLFGVINKFYPCTFLLV